MILWVFCILIFVFVVPPYIMFFREMHLFLPQTASQCLRGSELKPSRVGLTENRPLLRGLTFDGLTPRLGLGLHHLCPSGPWREDVGRGGEELTKCVAVHSR